MKYSEIIKLSDEDLMLKLKEFDLLKAIVNQKIIEYKNNIISRNDYLEHKNKLVCYNYIRYEIERRRRLEEFYSNYNNVKSFLDEYISLCNKYMIDINFIDYEEIGCSKLKEKLKDDFIVKFLNTGIDGSGLFIYNSLDGGEYETIKKDVGSTWINEMNDNIALNIKQKYGVI